MIISYLSYKILVIVLAILFVGPTVLKKFKKNKKTTFADFSFVLVLLLLPLNWYTPTIITVNSCDEYTKEVLILPKDGYSMGKCNYIVNNSDSDLALAHIAYQRVTRPDNTNEVVVIKPKETYTATNLVSIDYLFEDIPETVKSKSDETVKTALYCVDSEE